MGVAMRQAVTMGGHAAQRMAGTVFRQRIVRFGLVGGLGIPINLTLLWLAHGVARFPLAVAWFCAFEPTALINFVLYQHITFPDRRCKDAWDWLMRALRSQLSSFSAQGLNIAVFAASLQLGLHYLWADLAGIVAAFFANFLLCDRFVFRVVDSRTSARDPGSGKRPAFLAIPARWRARATAMAIPVARAYPRAAASPFPSARRLEPYIRGAVGALRRDRSLLAAFAISRALLILMTFLTFALFARTGSVHAPTSFTLWDVWYQWDARWYVRIATSGYHFQDLQHYASVAFFPLFPILIALLLAVAPISAKLAAIAVANATFLGALYALHRLAQREVGTRTATRAVLYISLFPTALFFFAGYSESPFLLFSVLAIWAMRERQWFWAGLCGGLAALTRSAGVLLAIPFMVECWMAYRARLRSVRRGAWICLIPLGTAIFALFLKIEFNHPLLFARIEYAWHRATTWPWVGLVQTVQRISPTHLDSYRSVHNVIELLSVLGFAALIAAGWRRLPRSFSLYACAALLLTLLDPAVLDNYYLPLRSTSRFCLVIFPCFITLGLLGRRLVVDRLVLAVSPALLAIFTLIFLQGGWVA